jgi:hypothetical protein
VIRDCTIDQDCTPLSQLILAECMENYGLEAGQAAGEWAGNIISGQTVVYSCGAIGRAGEKLVHNHHPSELALCRQLSQAAADLMQDQFIGLGDEGDHELLPFYVTANEGIAAPLEITEAVIRSAFGGMIDPHADIAIEPLEVGSEWWQEIAACCQEDEQILAAWQNLVQWFADGADLHHPVFVSIDNGSEAAEDAGGSVLPRLALALTPAGSLVGVISCVVYT